MSDEKDRPEHPTPDEHPGAPIQPLADPVPDPPPTDPGDVEGVGGHK